MKPLTKEQQKELAAKWERASDEMQRLRDEKLRDMEYNWEDVDALLELGQLANLPPRTTSGLVEMQRLFRAAHERSKGTKS